MVHISSNSNLVRERKSILQIRSLILNITGSRRKAGMAKNFLEQEDITVVLKHMGGIRMPQRMEIELRTEKIKSLEIIMKELADIRRT